MMSKILIKNDDDRQMRTYGKEANSKINSSSVIIVGLSGGLGTEICKNLTLAGVKELYLCDNSNVTLDDIEYGFYWNNEDIRKSSLIEKISELNPYTKVINYEGNLTEDFLKNKILVIINKTFDECSKYNDMCRLNNSKMISVFSSGLSGSIFVDFGENYKVFDLTGENIEPIQLSYVLKDGTVKCSKNVFHNLESGNCVKFNNVIGNNVDFLNNEWTIDVISRDTFVLNNFVEKSNNNFEFFNGSIIKVLKEKNFNSESFKNTIDNDNYIIGFEKEKSLKIINLYNQLLKLDYIDPWSLDMENRIQNFDKELSNLVRSFGTEIPSVTSLIGSIASSEVIKLITNKYTPINQWFTWNDDTLLNNLNIKTNNNCKSKLEKLFGSEYMNKLKELNILMVGCGAIGCEWLKIASLLNLSTNGEFVITDPDNIEKSNLNRQFLFRKDDINKPKTLAAANNIKKYNKILNIVPYIEKVCVNNREMTNKLFSNKDIVINALDNIKARKYVDELCLNRNLPLFESGTSGMKGNTQPVIPFLTETYSNSNDPPQEKSFPICTIKNFPNEIFHTIHWAIDYFDFFRRSPANINNFRENINFFDDLPSFEKEQAKNDIKNFVDCNINSWKDCALWAADIFYKEFVNNIKQLLNNFPKDSRNKDGLLFWSAGKRCPNILQFDLKNETVINFLDSTTHLLSRCSNIDDNFTKDELVEYLWLYKPKEFSIDKNLKIAENESQLKNDSEVKTISFDKERIKSLINKNFIVQNFEKDDDTNYHINFITAASNCRAMNYGIEIASFLDTKGIAGRIIPAVATTTSAIVGLVSLELMKYCMNINDIDSYKSTFINLADNTFVSSSPISAPMLKFGNKEVNSWTKFNLYENKKLKDFIEIYNKFFSCNINMVLYKSSILYANFLPSNNLDKYLSDLFLDKFSIDINKESVELVIDCDEDFELPTIQVFVK